MKFALLMLVLPVFCQSCEQHALTPLRETYDLETLRKLQEQGSTKLFMFNRAIAFDDMESLEILFTQGKKVVYEDLYLSQANRQGGEPVFFNPLHLAAQFGALKTTQFCLKNKARINDTTSSLLLEFHGNTPAHIAVMFSQHAILKMLLDQKGIDLSAKNGAGKTAEDLAREKGDQTALEVFEQARKAR